MNKADLLKKLESIKAGIDKAPANAKPLMQKAIDNIESQIAELDKEGNVKPEAKAETKTEGRAKAGRPKGTTKPKAEKVKRGRGRPAKKVVEKAPEEKPITEVQINKVAKDIREEGEPMIRARKRAKKALTEIKEVAKETKQMERKGTLTKSKILAEIKKLNKVFANLGVDIVVESADDLFRDATRTALPKGLRVSKNGKEYYESRPNRSDSLQGTAVYPKLKLAKGGIIRYEVKGNDLNEKLDNTRKMKSLIQKAYQTQDPEEDDKYPLNFIMNVALTGEIVKHDGKNYYIDYTFGGVKSYLRFSFLDNKYFLEALTYTNRPAIKKFAEGGMIETGDNVFVIGENKSGVVTNVIANGKHFSVLFADGTKTLYDKNELKKVYSDDDYDEYAKGGELSGKMFFGDASIEWRDRNGEEKTERFRKYIKAKNKGEAYRFFLKFIEDETNQFDENLVKNFLNVDEVETQDEIENATFMGYLSDKNYYAKGGELADVVVYDFGDEDESLDRYTIFTPDGSVYGMSENALGFNMYLGNDTEIEKGSHLGIKLKSVPEGIKKAVLDRMNEKYANGGKVDMNEVEESAKFYTDDSQWNPKPSIQKFQERLQESINLLRKLENKEITPSKIVGGGYKSSSVARKVALDYLENRIAVYKRSIEILKERGVKYAKGGRTYSMPEEKIIS